MFQIYNFGEIKIGITKKPKSSNWNAHKKTGVWEEMETKDR